MRLAPSSLTSFFSYTLYHRGHPACIEATATPSRPDPSFARAKMPPEPSLLHARRPHALHPFSPSPTPLILLFFSQTLNPDAVFLLGDNVYNDNIANWGLGGSPVASIQSYMTDADAEFYEIHGFGSPEEPGPVLHSFLDILKDKLQACASANAHTCAHACARMQACNGASMRMRV
eukprot:6191571-Pleurochrysis_carterae.AAC.3